VHDISLAGLRTHSDEPHPVGARLELELFFPDGGSATMPFCRSITTSAHCVGSSRSMVGSTGRRGIDVKRRRQPWTSAAIRFRSSG